MLVVLILAIGLLQLATLRKVGLVMAIADDLRVLLDQVAVTLGEVATDVDDLVAHMGTGGLTAAEAEEVKTKLTDISTNLRTVADKHTPSV